MKLSRVAILLVGAVVLGCKERPAETSPAAPAGEVWLNEKQVEDARLVVEPVRVRPVGVAGGGACAGGLRRPSKVAHVFSPVAGRVVQVLASPATG